MSTFSISGTDTDLDRFGAKVMWGFIRGLRTVREAIVMSRPDGRIYAAVIDGDVVKYFSNDPAFKTELPDTIQRWREAFSDLKVVFWPRFTATPVAAIRCVFETAIVVLDSQPCDLDISSS